MRQAFRRVAHIPMHMAPSILSPFNISSPYLRNIYETNVEKTLQIGRKTQLDASWTLGPTDWVHLKFPLHLQMGSCQMSLQVHLTKLFVFLAVLLS